MRVVIVMVMASYFGIANAQVVVNEFSASNLENWVDQFGKTEDWIELYNPEDQLMDISGFHISDKESKPGKWKLPNGTIIPAKGYLMLYCSGRDTVLNGEYHTNFKLSQTTGKDKIVFSNPNEEILEIYDMPITLVEHSYCRAADGGDNWVICAESTPERDNSQTSQFQRYTEAPSMSLEAGFYEGIQMVSITNNEPNSVLRYTTNGRNPTVNDPEYTVPIVISSTTVVKAISFSNENAIHTGKMDFNTYFIDEDFSLAVFSVAADQVTNLANGQGELIPIGSLEYFNLDKEREATSFGSLNRHGQDSWVLDHRSLDWVSRDEMGYSKAVNAPLFAFSERDEYQKFMFRNSGDDNYPAINDGQHEFSTHIRDEYVQTLAMEGGMELDNRAVERVILFLNGQYWGVYGMRDRPVDHDYTGYYYDQGKYETQYLTTWGNTEIQYGGRQAAEDWIGLRDFIMTNDMSIPENYERAEDELNMTSLIDYMVANLTAVASDWLNYNTGWWRGTNPDGKHKKWGYILWDLDATFDYYINYSGVPDISPNAKACDLDVISNFIGSFFGNGTINPNTTQINIFEGFDGDVVVVTNDGDVGRHDEIFLKLLDESSEFKQLYYSRYADLINTVYSCENMIETLERMVDVIRPEMPRQIQRWGGTMQEWESNVQRLKDFINQRCELIDDGMLECYNELSGTYELTLRTVPDGIGEIDLNTLDIEEFPWTGDYFGGMENKIKAKVFNDFEDEYEFSHWESSNGNVIFPDANSRKATITLTASDTLTAVFGVPTSIDELSQDHAFKVYPNPVQDRLIFEYDLEESSEVRISLSSLLGEEVALFTQSSGRKSAGRKQEVIDLSQSNLPPGIYILNAKINEAQKSFKISVIN